MKGGLRDDSASSSSYKVEPNAWILFLRKGLETECKWEEKVKIDAVCIFELIPLPIALKG